MSGLKKANGISISKQIQKDFSAAAAEIEDSYKIYLQLVQITGRRWAYLSGTRFEDLPPFPPERIELGRDFGVVVYPLQPLSSDQKAEIREKIARELKNV